MDVLKFLLPVKGVIKGFLVFILSGTGFPLLVRFSIFICSLLAIFSSKSNTIDLAGIPLNWLFSLIATTALVSVFSPKLRSYYLQSDFCGEWTYENEPELVAPASKQDQLKDQLRYVKIDIGSNGLKIKGKIKGQEIDFFHTEHIVLDGFGKKEGKLIYRYVSPPYVNTKERFSGTVVLNWEKDKLSSQVSSMFGRFYGEESEAMGMVKWTRVPNEAVLSEIEATG